MCGIAGIIRFDGAPADESALRGMMKVMKHRGPDDEGVYTDNSTGFGFVRLSILDLSELGHQPMHSADGELTIIFNGEIFNYIELRQELQSFYPFKSGSDTEVILAAYLRWGKGCLGKLNGMWAFAIHDKRNDEVFISRDRFGIKPLYYYQDDTKFVFASDIPPVLSVKEDKRKANDKIIYDFLMFNRTNHSDETFFSGVKKLQHSGAVSIKNGSVSFSRWYNLYESTASGFNDGGEFLELFKDSVKMQLRSDVPLGICLSGGLDSSAIVSTVQKYYHNPELHTFSAIYGKNQVGDESDFINSYDGIVKNQHFTKPDADTLLADLDDFITALSEPIPGTSEYAEYKVMQLASEYCTVILNGQGADEQMGGYHYFFGFFYRELLQKFRLLRLINESRAYNKLHGGRDDLKSLIYFLLPEGMKNSRGVMSKQYISPGFYSEFANIKNSDITGKLYGSRNLNESLYNHYEYKFEHHLLWADKSGMWFSLETRFPFLDHRFAEQLLATDSSKKIGSGITKKIMREAFTGILPEKIRTRYDKVGYETPEDNWMREKRFSEMMKDIFGSQSFRNRGYIDPAEADKLMAGQQSGQSNAKELWKMLHLELWFRKFIDG